MNQLLLSAACLLADGDETKQSWFQKYGLWIVLGVIVVLLVVWFVFSGRKNKQKQKEYVEQLDAIAPGHKVKTAGGICGIVTEVCDDNTVIIKTGSEDSGYSYIKMEKELIAQTDAKGPTQIAREAAEEKRRLEKEAAAQKQSGAALQAAEGNGDGAETVAALQEEAKAEEPAFEELKEEPKQDEPAVAEPEKDEPVKEEAKAEEPVTEEEPKKEAAPAKKKKTNK